MKHYLLAVSLICFGSLAQASPYFRLMRPLDEAKTGVFVKVGTPNDNLTYGFQTTLVKHRAEDGYLVLPGVSWSLLDVGAAKSPTGRMTAVLGPSVDLSEPVKAALLVGFNKLWPTSMGSIKALLVPAEAGKACLAASIGPGLGLDLGGLNQIRDIKGALVLHAGLSAKWK